MDALIEFAAMLVVVVPILALVALLGKPAPKPDAEYEETGAWK
jgi:hypothetical protein